MLKVSGNCVVPLGVWSSAADGPPIHRVTSILVSSCGTQAVTGGDDGGLITWNIDANWKFHPRLMLIGHKCSVTNLCLADESPECNKTYFVSASNTGEMGLWDWQEGRCLEFKVESKNIYTSIQSHQPVYLDYRLVLCLGQFPELTVLHAMTLSPLYTLVSKAHPNWVTAATVFTHPSRKSDIILGVTFTGAVNMWTLGGEEIQGETKQENESQMIEATGTIELSCCPQSPRTVLVVKATEWQIYDAVDWSVVCTQQYPKGDPFVSGKFLSIQAVVMASRSGNIYLYKLPSRASGGVLDLLDFTQSKTPILLATLATPSPAPCRVPVLQIITTHDPYQGQNQILVASQPNLSLAVWNISDTLTLTPSNKGPHLVQPNQSSNLAEVWKRVKPRTLLDCFNLSHISMTSSCVIYDDGRIAMGLANGSILIVGIIDLLTSYFFTKSNEPPVHMHLEGHIGVVTCLLHPSADRPTSTRSPAASSVPPMAEHDPSHLVSAGEDFSVRVWDLIHGTPIHVFYPHSAPIRLLCCVPKPEGVRARSLVCTVGDDNAVVLLSLRERKVKLHASQQRSTVVHIGWKIHQDFMMVLCRDGTLFVWEISSGFLDRQETGQIGQDLIESCDAHTPVRCPRTGQLLLPSVPRKARDSRYSRRSCLHSLVVQPIKMGQLSDSTDQWEANTLSISHVFYFDTESLIVELINDAHHHTISRSRTDALINYSTESQSALKNKKMTNYRTSPGTQSNVKLYQNTDRDQNGTDSNAMSDDLRGPMHRSRTQQLFSQSLAHLLASILLPWQHMAGLDRTCRDTLGLQSPLSPFTCGQLGQSNTLALVMPGWLPSSTLDGGDVCHPYWSLTSGITSTHLLALCSLAHTFAVLPDEVFVDWHENHLSSSKSIGSAVSMKQVWCLLESSLAELPGHDCSRFKAPLIQHLLHKWQDSCMQIREAAQALLCAYLDSLTLSVRQTLVDQWASHLPPFATLDSASPLATAVANQVPPPDSVSLASLSSNEETTGGPLLDSDWLAKTKGYRPAEMEDQLKLQALSVVLLGVVGSRYGGNSSSQTEQTSVQEGFGLDNYHLARCTCKALTSLVIRSRNIPHVNGGPSLASSAVASPDHFHSLQANVATAPSLNQSPSHQTSPHHKQQQANIQFNMMAKGQELACRYSPVRRAAVDLLGRGFTVWEPYLEVAHLLNTLLQLAAEADAMNASIHSGFPVPDHIDLALTARSALSLIALARPKAYVITLSREVLRYNHHLTNPSGPPSSGNASTASPGPGSAHGHHGNSSGSASSDVAGNGGAGVVPVYAARHEVVSVLEVLCAKKAPDLVDVLAELVDILLLCIDKTSLKDRTFEQIFPPIKKFCTVSSSPKSQKVCVGGRNGIISFYDYKVGKYHTTQGHKFPVTAVAFASDGKQVATYSMQENMLRVWQASTSNLFGMGGNQVKLISTQTIPAPLSSQYSNAPISLWLEWADSKGINLVSPAGIVNAVRI